VEQVRCRKISKTFCRPLPRDVIPRVSIHQFLGIMSSDPDNVSSVNHSRRKADLQDVQTTRLAICNCQCQPYWRTYSALRRQIHKACRRAVTRCRFVDKYYNEVRTVFGVSYSSALQFLPDVQMDHKVRHPVSCIRLHGQ